MLLLQVAYRWAVQRASFCLPARSAGIGSFQIGMPRSWRLLLALGFPPPESHCCLTVRRECRLWALLLFKEKLSQVSLPVPMGLTRAAPMYGITAIWGASLVAPDLSRGH